MLYVVLPEIMSCPRSIRRELSESRQRRKMVPFDGIGLGSWIPREKKPTTWKPRTVFVLMACFIMAGIGLTVGKAISWKEPGAKGITQAKGDADELKDLEEIGGRDLG